MLKNFIITTNHALNAFIDRHYPVLWFILLLMLPALLILQWSVFVYSFIGVDCPWFFYPSGQLQYFVGYMNYAMTPFMLITAISAIMGLVAGLLFKEMYGLTRDEVSFVWQIVMGIFILLLFFPIYSSSLVDLLVYALYDLCFPLLLLNVLLYNIIIGENSLFQGVLMKKWGELIFSFQYFTAYAGICTVSSRHYERIS